MKQKKMLTLTLSQLKQLYQQELPELCQLAGQSINDKDFRNSLERFLSLHPQAESNPGKQIRLLINYDGTNIHELSTGQDMPVQTLSVLHQFLIGQLENTDLTTDLFIDLFYLFKRLDAPEMPLPSPQRIKSRTERWVTGLDEEVMELRAQNKERMLHVLIQKIENRKSGSTRFKFDEGLSYDEKYQLVST